MGKFLSFNADWTFYLAYLRMYNVKIKSSEVYKFILNSIFYFFHFLACPFFTNFAYVGGTPLSPAVTQSSQAKCQTSCVNNALCFFWSYDKTLNLCTLYGNNPGTLTAATKFGAGPKVCWANTPAFSFTWQTLQLILWQYCMRHCWLKSKKFSFLNNKWFIQWIITGSISLKLWIGHFS